MQEIRTTSPVYFESNENYSAAEFAKQGGQAPLRRQIQQRFMPVPPQESMFKSKRREKELQSSVNTNAALKSRPMKPMVSSAVRLGIEKPPTTAQPQSNAPKQRELGAIHQAQKLVQPLVKALYKSTNEAERENVESGSTQVDTELNTLREELKQLQEALQASETNHKQEFEELQACMKNMEAKADLERTSLSQELAQVQKEKENISAMLSETQKKLEEARDELQAEVVRGGAIRAASEKLASDASEVEHLKEEIETLKSNLKKSEVEASVNHREIERHRLDCERLKLVLDTVEKELLESKKEKELLADALRLEREKVSLQRTYLMKKGIPSDII